MKIEVKKNTGGSDATSAFWGVVCESGKKYTHEVERKFRVTMATLDPTIRQTSEVVSLTVECNNEQHLLCNLKKETIPQVKLDLMFGRGEKITFSIKGAGTVHLSGYYISTDIDALKSPAKKILNITNSKVVNEKEKLSKVEKDSIIVSEDVNKSGKKSSNKKIKKKKGSAKNILNDSRVKNDKSADKLSQDEKNDLSDDDWADVDDMDDVDLSDDDLFDEMDFSDDGSDKSDDENVSDEKPTVAKAAAKKVPQPKGSALATMKQILDEESSSDDEEEDSDLKLDPPSKGQKRESNTKVENEKTAKKLKFEVTPFKQKKLKPTDMNSSIGCTPRPSSKIQKELDLDEADDLPPTTPKAADSSTETPSSKKKRKKNKKKKSLGTTPKMAGGLELEDLRVGAGPTAMKGKLVHVHYKGTLESGKVFDSSKPTDKPFSFRLGAGEVIKGWDMGLEGMKVGGKRKLKIPASLGYKNQRMGEIPPNSTLNFEVVLKAVS